MIELTNDQKNAITKAKNWFYSSSGKQIFELSGYAGTGKTTVVHSLIEELGLNKYEVLFGAYTGKAALLLTLSGNSASTIHQMIYDVVIEEQPSKDKNGKTIMNERGEVCYENVVSFKKKESLSSKIKLIVLDECSMISEEMLNDIKSFEIPIIVLGDPCQLKPINGESILLRNPDIVMTQIMRQQEDNPLVYLATLARERKNIPEGNFGSSYVISRNEVDQGMNAKIESIGNILVNEEINICRTNKTRNRINNYVRHDIMGIEKDRYLPRVGEKMICRKNNWSKVLHDEMEVSLVNGLTGSILSPPEKDTLHNCFYCDFQPDFLEYDFFSHIPISDINLKNYDEKKVKFYTYRQYQYSKQKNLFINQFEFAYCLTDYLSQGSTYDSCFIYDEVYGNQEDYYNSLYVMITRARKRIILAKQYPKSYY